MSENYVNARKKGWLEGSVFIHNFHVEHLRINENWSYRDTSRELNRSLGSVSQAIKIARWLKTHPNKIQSFYDLKSALEWIREMDKDRKSEMV